MSFRPIYILAQEAEERIVALFRKERGDAAEIFNTAIDACQSIILDMYDNSSEDVVPVVKCKNCKYRNKEDGFCEGRGFPAQLVPDNGFCDKAERSEDGET